MPVDQLLQLRRGTAAAWISANPVLSQGEPGFETDTGNQKIGDGVTAWTSLNYTGSGTYAPITINTIGAPTTGMWPTGQSVIDALGNIYNCTAGGDPGTWVGASYVTAVTGPTGTDLYQNGVLL